MFLSTLILAVVAAVHGATLALQNGTQGPLLILFAAIQLLTLPVWGAFCDRLGCKKTMLYSLALCFVVGLAGYAPEFGVRLPANFVFAVFGGMVSAGLPMALGYFLNLKVKGEVRPLMLGAVAGGFFGGMALMTAFRLFAFSNGHGKPFVLIATAFLLLSALAFAIVAFLLPDVWSTSVEFIGFNALQGLWHGFAASSRADFAAVWKPFLGFSTLASSAVLSGASCLIYVSDRATGIAAATRCLVAGMAAAAFASLAMALVLRVRPKAEGFLTIACAATILLSAIVVLVAGDRGISFAFASAVLGGFALGTVVILSLIRFAGAAQTRSAGAEMGAVGAIWLAGYSVGSAFAMAGLLVGPEVPLWASLLASLIGVLLAVPAARCAR